MTPTTAAAMGAVPVGQGGRRLGRAQLFRQVGGSLGIALIGAIVATQEDPTTPVLCGRSSSSTATTALLYVAR